MAAAGNTSTAAENEQNVTDPEPYQLAQYDNIYKSNISQKEYTYKHRIFFEDIRRAELRRRRKSAEPIDSLQFRRMYSFEPIDETTLPSENELKKRFSYRVDIPRPHNNSITELESMELHLQIIPQSCQNQSQITLRVFQEEKKVYVDASRPRWESLTVHPMPSHLDTFTITCLDCLKANVTFSPPFLNVVTINSRRKRYRRQPSKKERRQCRLSPLVIDFRELPSFQDVISPRTADIGRCRGTCINDFKAHSQHSFFRYDLARIGKGPNPCCLPSKYINMEYLKPKRTKLQRYHWVDAIAIQCTCH